MLVYPLHYDFSNNLCWKFISYHHIPTIFVGNLQVTSVYQQILLENAKPTHYTNTNVLRTNFTLFTTVMAIICPNISFSLPSGRTTPSSRPSTGFYSSTVPFFKPFGQITPSLRPSSACYSSSRAFFQTVWTNNTPFTAFTQSRSGRRTFLRAAGLITNFTYSIY